MLALVNKIRNSPKLNQALDDHNDEAFFTAIALFAEGRHFLSLYKEAGGSTLDAQEILDIVADVRRQRITLKAEALHSCHSDTGTFCSL